MITGRKTYRQNEGSTFISKQSFLQNLRKPTVFRNLKEDSMPSKDRLGIPKRRFGGHGTPASRSMVFKIEAIQKVSHESWAGC